MLNRICLLAIVLFTLELHAQVQVTAFPSTMADRFSAPQSFIPFHDRLFFTAFTESDGREIWYTQVEDTFPTLLADLFPGRNDGVTFFQETAVPLGDYLYFAGNDGVSNGELWRTDGTTAGTEKITTHLNFPILKLTKVGDALFFTTVVRDSLQVWKSDGSAAGTQLVTAGIPIIYTPHFEGTVNGVFIFTCNETGSKSKVWRSDGTAAGTYPITALIDGNGAGINGTAALTQYIVYQDVLYFVTRHTLMKTDGTVENTIEITNKFDHTPELFDFADVAVFNGLLYFTFFDESDRRLLIWESDGTDAGTINIYDHEGSYHHLPSNLVFHGQSLYFTGAATTEGTALIRFDLLTRQDTILRLLLPETNQSFFLEPATIIQNNDSLLFISLAETDFSFLGTVITFSGNETISFDSLTSVRPVLYGEHFYFSKDSRLYGSELWRTDGTTAGSGLYANINQYLGPIFVGRAVALDSLLIFRGRDTEYGNELWSYDGDSLRVVKDINAGTVSSSPGDHIRYKDHIYFTARDPDHGLELWRTDGTADSTKLFFDSNEGAASSNYLFLFIWKDELHFVVSKNERYVLFKTNGLAVDSLMDFGWHQNGFGYRPEEMITTGEYIYYIRHAYGEELWRTDGTGAGTTQLAGYITCEKLSAVKNRVFFTAKDTTLLQLELYTTDGTVEGTRIAANINDGYDAEPQQLTAYHNRIYFSAYTEQHGREVWSSDGTQAGTRILVDMWPGISSGIIDPQFFVFDDYLYLSGNDGIHGPELWKTYGTTAGTEMVMDINHGSLGSYPGPFYVYGDQLFFQAYTREHGDELWMTNKTNSQTKLIADFLPGEPSSTPDNFIGFDDAMYCVAQTINDGRQLWKISLPESTANEITCSDFCITQLVMDTLFTGILNARLLFTSSDSMAFINYPYIAALIDAQGDTVATGSINFFGQFANTEQDYPLTTTWDVVPAAFEGSAIFHYDTNTCVLPYLCLTANHDADPDLIDIAVFPNPMQREATLWSSQLLDGMVLEIINVQGQLIMHINQMEGFTHEFRLNLPSGMYYVLLSDQGKIIGQKKVIIQE